MSSSISRPLPALSLSPAGPGNSPSSMLDRSRSRVRPSRTAPGTGHTASVHRQRLETGGGEEDEEPNAAYCSGQRARRERNRRRCCLGVDSWRRRRDPGLLRQRRKPEGRRSPSLPEGLHGVVVEPAGQLVTLLSTGAGVALRAFDAAPTGDRFALPAGAVPRGHDVLQLTHANGFWKQVSRTEY